MAAEHAPTPDGGAADEPTPDAADGWDAHGESAAATRPAGYLAAARPTAVYKRGEDKATTRASRLLPSGPALEHAPLLLGLDAEGGEHPQGGDHEDDEDLVGRVWGCVCGWRGTVRDIHARPFHPRVGDGGRLRRQRLARSDRDARAELESHLAHITSTPAGPPTSNLVLPSPTKGTSLDDTASGQAETPPRARRRRLTLPRDSHLATSTSTATRAVSRSAVNGELYAPTDDGGDVELTASLGDQTRSDAAPASHEHIATSEHGPLIDEAPAHDVNGGAQERGTAGLLAAAVERTEIAQVELTAANSALDAAVAAARMDGLSWRTIGRTAGLGHREAAARWGSPGGGHSL